MWSLLYVEYLILSFLCLKAIDGCCLLEMKLKCLQGIQGASDLLQALSPAYSSLLSPYPGFLSCPNLRTGTPESHGPLLQARFPLYIAKKTLVQFPLL